MNDFDLEMKLRSILVPERTDEYWTDFPSRVRMHLARGPGKQAGRQGSLRWGWTGGLALACALLLLSFAPVFHAVFKNDRLLCREAQRLSQGMHVLMADQHGMKNLVIDSE